VEWMSQEDWSEGYEIARLPRGGSKKVDW